MKAKDTNFFQQHVEKIGLVVAVLFFLGVGAYYLGGDPHAAEFQGERITPGEIESRLADAVQSVERAIATDGGLPERTEQPAYAADFKQRFNAIAEWRSPGDREGARRTLAFAVPLELPGLAPAVLRGGDYNQPDYYVPRPPVPKRPVVRTGYGVLGSMDDSDHRRELIQTIGQQRAQDLRWASVAARFPMDDYVQRFQEGPSDPNLETLREQWWEQRRGLAGVYLQRQELDPLTGEWGNTTIIEPLPGQMGYLPRQGDWEISEIQPAIDELLSNQEHVARPEFLPLVKGIWQAPDPDRQLSAGDHREIHKLIQDILQDEQRRQTLLDQIDLIEKREARLRDRDQRTSNSRRPQRQSSRDRADRGGPPPEAMRDQSGSSSRNRQSFRRDDSNRSQTSRVEQRLQQIEEDLAQQYQELADLWGIDFAEVDRRRPTRSGSRGGSRGDLPPDMPPEVAAELGLTSPQGGSSQQGRRSGGRGESTPEDAGDVRVWAHDVTVEPGKTYRYRVVVATINPMFGLSLMSEEQKEELFNKIALEPSGEDLARADWTDPVTIDPEHYFFLVGGNPASQLANVEAWTLDEGQWRDAEFSVRPGDFIGGEGDRRSDGVDIESDAVVVDVVDSPEGESGVHMLYLPPGEEELARRSRDEDSRSVQRIRLENEQHKPQLVRKMQSMDLQ